MCTSAIAEISKKGNTRERERETLPHTQTEKLTKISS